MILTHGWLFIVAHLLVWTLQEILLLQQVICRFRTIFVLSELCKENLKQLTIEASNEFDWVACCKFLGHDHICEVEAENIHIISAFKDTSGLFGRINHPSAFHDGVTTRTQVKNRQKGKLTMYTTCTRTFILCHVDDTVITLLVFVSPTCRTTAGVAICSAFLM